MVKEQTDKSWWNVFTVFVHKDKGWERNFIPKKFRGIDSEWFPLFRGRKCSFRGIPSSAEEPIPKLGTERKGTEFREKMKFYGTRTASMIILTTSTFYKKLVLQNKEIT